MSIFQGLSLLRRASCVLLSAAAVFHMACVWIALCGLSAISQAVLLSAFTATCGLTLWLQRFLPAPNSSHGPRLYSVLLATGLGLAGSALLPWALTQLMSIAAAALPIPEGMSAVWIYGLLAVLPCGILSIVIAASRAMDGAELRFRPEELLLPLIALPAVHLLSIAGISPVMLMTAFAGLAVVCLSLGAFPVVSVQPEQGVTATAAEAGTLLLRNRRMLSVCSGASAGLLAIVLSRFWGQLLPLTILQLVLLSAVAAVTFLSLKTLTLKMKLLGSVPGRLVSGACLLPLLLFAWLQPELPAIFLGITEQTEPGLLQLVARAIAAGAITGVLYLGLVPAGGASRGAAVDVRFAVAFVCALPIGVVLNTGIAIATLLPPVLGLCVVCGFMLRLSVGEYTGLSKAGLRACAPLAIVLFSIPLVAPQFDLAGASRLLFAGRTLEARSRGLGMDLIRHTEPARLAGSATGVAGELSVWRQSAVSFEMLRSGVVTAKGSSDTRIQPQAPEEVLPAILGLCNHSRPGRVLLLGDDSGALLRTCTHFPVQQILAVRVDPATTAAATEFLWRHAADRPDRDSRVQLLHADLPLAVRCRELGQFDVVVAAGGPAAAPGHVPLLTREFYAAVRARLSAGGVFCQRLTLDQADPELLRQVLATLSSEFQHAGVIQMLPGEFLLAASDSEDGLIHPELLERLQRGHVQREAAACGWDWAQMAVLPLAESGGETGVFAKASVPRLLTVSSGGALLPLSVPGGDATAHSEKLRAAFAPFQRQIAAAVPAGEAHEEAKRRLAALQQQVEILAGMPDQPWTYRRSLRMEMQRSPRPPVEKVEGGRIIRSTHPLDALRQDYFLTLGEALQSVQSAPARSLEAVRKLSRIAEGGEPLLGWFSHYEIVRLYELLERPDAADELRHRLHLVFYAAPSDASVRPAISALQMLVEQPELIADPAERYDLLNAVLQKLIERWEARTAWEPRSAVRVQQDVDLSVLAGRRAMEQMQELAAAAGIRETDFQQRRQFVHAALISPLRVYCEQVLAHRMKTESPATAAKEDPDDLPLLAPAAGINTN
ncbi:MAG: spermidine synthase [Planctomycetaceae bacterium]